jgi:beta-N-acetylhexosaminidase
MFFLSAPLNAQPDPLANMTLEQRVAQMFMVTLHGGVMTEQGAAFLQQWQPGAVVLFAANLGAPDAVTRLTNGYQQAITSAGGVPLLVAVDQEGGVVARLTDGFTVFPAPMLTAAAGDEMAWQVGAATAGELRAVGINMNLAPVADMETYRDNPIIFRRSFGSVPEYAASSVAAFAQGSQSVGVLATAKHFPGHGDTRQDSHAVLQSLDLSRERLDSVELVPFRAAIDADVAAVMLAHIHYPVLQPGAPIPASLDRRVVTDLLRDELGFEGIIMTDALDMNAVDITFDFREAAVRAVEAGVDLLSFGPSFGAETQAQAIQAVIDAVRSGRIPESRIDESAARLLAAKAQYGLLDWQPLDPAGAVERVAAADGAATMEALFQRGVTVAWDNSDLIPVRPEQRVAVIFLATRYQIVNDCGAYRDDIEWVGASDSPSDDEIGWARAAADRADTTIVWTQDAYLNPRQQALVNAMPPARTAVVALWSPYDALALPDVGAFVALYSPLRPAVPAACAVIFGAREATGRWVVGDVGL